MQKQPARCCPRGTGGVLSSQMVQALHLEQQSRTCMKARFFPSCRVAQCLPRQSKRGDETLMLIVLCPNLPPPLTQCMPRLPLYRTRQPLCEHSSGSEVSALLSSTTGVQGERLTQKCMVFAGCASACATMFT